jgi:hypothetical protein
MNEAKPINEQTLRILRKLGACEIVYDYEASIGNLYLVHAFKIKTNLNIAKKRFLVENAILIWKQANPLLNSRILTIGKDKYFALADKSKTSSCDNLTMYLLKSGEQNTSDSDQYWRLLYDYEFNRAFVNSENGLLWRLIFIQNDEKNVSDEFTNWIIFTTHHAIVDVSFAEFYLSSNFSQ